MADEWVDADALFAAPPPPAASAAEWVDVPDDWNAWRSAQQFGAGAVEGTGKLLAFGGDLAGLMFGMPNRNPVTGNVFGASEAAEELAQDYLPARDPQYRYARTIGEFVGPQAFAGGMGKIAEFVKGGAGPFSAWMKAQMGLRPIATMTAAGAGSQAGGDLTGDSFFGRMGGAVLGGGAVSALWDVGKGLKSAILGPGDDEVRGAAANAFREQTGLSPEALEQAIAERPPDELGRLMTTAEVTENAGAAQLEKELAAAGKQAGKYNQLAVGREQAREELLSGMAQTQGTNKEGLGTSLMNAAHTRQEEMQTAAEELWRAVPRHTDIDITAGQAEIGGILGRRQAGLEPRSAVKTLVRQFLEEAEDGQKVTGRMKSGALQDIRSDALRLLREEDLSPIESQLLASLQSEADDAVRITAERSGDPQTYAQWTDARQATSAAADTFKRGRAGGSLVAETARPSNALANAMQGDSRSVKELARAVNGDPELMDQVKRGVLEMIPRDGANQLTPVATKRFIQANRGALQELLGGKHYTALERILEDLQSQAGVQRMANRASVGGSVTGQKVTVAGKISELISGAMLPGSGVVGRSLEMLRSAAGVGTRDRITELLFRAALEPEFALDLAKTPSNLRVYNMIDRLKDAIVGVGTRSGAARAGVLEGDRASKSGNAFAPNPRGAPPAAKSAGSSIQEKVTEAILPKAEASMLPKKPQETGDDAVISTISNQLLDAVRKVETGSNPNQTSAQGAQGPYQLMPKTGKEYHAKLGLEGKYDPFDERQARKIATAILEDYARQTGSVPLAVTAYHSGVSAAKSGKLGPKGRAYLPAVEAAFAALNEGAA